MTDHLAELCRLRASTHGERCAVEDGSASVTYAELAGRAQAVAERLRGLGIGPGDRVVLQGRNSVAWVVAAFGVLTSGATLAPIGYAAPAPERERLCALLAPAAMVAEDDPGDHTGVPWLRLADALDLPTRAPEDGTAPDLGQPDDVADLDAPAVVLASSGTTGAATLVPMTHRQLARLYADVTRVLGVVEDDRLLGVVPLAHSFGLNGVLLVSMLAGATVRLCPVYDRDGVAELVRTERLSVLSGPPTLFHDLERSAAAGPPVPAAGLLGGVARLAVVGGQAVQIAELLATARRLGLREVVVGYGMTQACGTVALARLAVTACVGAQVALTPMPGVEVRIGGVDAPLPVGQTGEILVRGHNVAASVTVDGWYDTGDLGSLDADGRLVVLGRSSDRVIVSGFTVHPRDVERVLAEHPDVEQVVVVGVPDERRGERLVACVVARHEAPGLDPEAVRAFARERISAYQVPTEILAFAELPLTHSGKIARGVLRERVAERLTSD